MNTTLKILIAISLTALAIGVFLRYSKTVEAPQETESLAGGTGTLNQLDQWKKSGVYITQNVASTPIKLTGLESSNDCLITDASGVVSTSACGSGGGGGSNWTPISGGLRTSTSTDFARAANFVGTSTSALNTFAGRVGIGTTTPTAGLSAQLFSGNALLEIGNYTTNDSTTKLLVKNRWTGNGGASVAVYGTAATSPHFYIGGGGSSAFGTTTNTLTSRLTVWGSGTTNDSSNFVASNNASTTLFQIKNAGEIYMLGNVGIGTMNPTQKVQITTSGTNNIQYALRLQNPNNTTSLTSTGIAFTNDTDSSLAKGALVYTAKYNYGRGDFLFLQNSITDLTVPTLSDAVMAITNAGNVGIGSTSPSRLLTVQGDGYFLNNITAASSTFTNSVSIGTTSTAFKLTATGTVGLYNLTAAAGTPNSICQNATTKEITVNAALTCTVSARDQKADINAFDLSALDMVMQLKPSTFFYKDNLDRERLGFIADELQAVDPRLGDAYKDGNARSIDIPALIALNTKAIQELYMKVDGKGAIAGAKRSVDKNYQWVLIALLLVWVVRLEIKTRK